MGLLLLSVVLVLLSSYLITSILKPSNFLTGFIYFVVSAFAQIVLIAELLSPFKFLYQGGFIFLQVIIAIITAIVWFKSGRPVFIHTPVQTFKSILKSLCSDRPLLILGVCFVFFLAVSLFLSCVMGIRSGDAEVYHAARSIFWVNNHSINHFFTSQVRMLAFPVNSEILYSWIILFTNKTIGLSVFSFLGFLLSVSALFGVMNNFSIKRRLWVIFILASFASVLGQASGTETDIIISGLVLSSMYLFKNSIIAIGGGENHISRDKFVPLFMSALCYALAIGTKTTALFLVPAVAIFMIYNSYKYLKKDYFKPFLYFLGFGLINFILFAAYNYIENLLWFGNPLGAYNTIEMHKNYYGVKGAAANIIKNATLFFDFTGFTWNAAAGKIIIPLRDFLLISLNLFDIPDGVNSGNSAVLNNAILAPLMGCGILGLIVFIPSLIFCLAAPLFCRSKTRYEYFLYAAMFILTFVIMSYAIVFMTYNNRFIASFIVVCAPVIGCTYFRKFKIGKWFITLIAVFYLTLVSTHLWHQPFFKIIDALFVKGQSLSEVQKREAWSKYDSNTDKLPVEIRIANVIRSYPKDTKFVIFPSYKIYFATLAILNNEGWHVDIRSLEAFDIKELANYDVIIYGLNDQSANVAYRYEKNKNSYEIIKGKIYFKNPAAPINCIYFTRENKVIIPGVEGNPTGAQCILNEKYVYDAGYRLDNIVYNRIEPNSDEAILEYMFLKKKQNNK